MINSYLSYGDIDCLLLVHIKNFYTQKNEMLYSAPALRGVFKNAGELQE